MTNLTFLAFMAATNLPHLVAYWRHRTGREATTNQR